MLIIKITSLIRLAEFNRIQWAARLLIDIASASVAWEKAMLAQNEQGGNEG
jgi:hypothetical protein